MSKEYRDGYSRGFLDGFELAKNNPSMIFPTVPNPINISPQTTPQHYVCTKCGVNWEKAGAMGYVCSISDCYNTFKGFSP